MIADMFLERYFATAMAIFALFLSAGSQVGPVIAGYLIADRGWRWFFILCAILVGINLFFCLFLLPETTFRRPWVHDGETAAEVDKEVLEMIENAGGMAEKGTQAASIEAEPTLRKLYWKDLVTFADRGQEEKGLKAFPTQFSLPFRFLLVPAALYATIAYGVILAGYA